MQQSQGGDEGAAAALEEDDLVLRIEDESDVVLAAGVADGRVCSGRYMAWRSWAARAHHLQTIVSPFLGRMSSMCSSSAGYESMMEARMPRCSDDFTLLCVLMLSALENLRAAERA